VSTPNLGVKFDSRGAVSVLDLSVLAKAILKCFVDIKSACDLKSCFHRTFMVCLLPCVRGSLEILWKHICWATHGSNVHSMP
jgi:hypothetical protein